MLQILTTDNSLCTEKKATLSPTSKPGTRTCQGILSCFFLKGIIATCETHLDLTINSGDPLQQTTEATAATEDI